MQDFDNAVFFALVSNILTTFRQRFKHFVLRKPLQLQKRSNLSSAEHSKNDIYANGIGARRGRHGVMASFLSCNKELKPNFQFI